VVKNGTFLNVRDSQQVETAMMIEKVVVKIDDRIGVSYAKASVLPCMWSNCVCRKSKRRFKGVLSIREMTSVHRQRRRLRQYMLRQRKRVLL